MKVNRLSQSFCDRVCQLSALDSSQSKMSAMFAEMAGFPSRNSRNSDTNSSVGGVDQRICCRKLKVVCGWAYRDEDDRREYEIT